MRAAQPWEMPLRPPDRAEERPCRAAWALRLEQMVAHPLEAILSDGRLSGYFFGLLLGEIGVVAVACPISYAVLEIGHVLERQRQTKARKSSSWRSGSSGSGGRWPR